MNIILDITYQNGPNYSADYYSEMEISELDLIPYVQSLLEENSSLSPKVKSVEIIRIEK